MTTERNSGAAALEAIIIERKQAHATRRYTLSELVPGRLYFDRNNDLVTKATCDSIINFTFDPKGPSECCGAEGMEPFIEAPPDVVSTFQNAP